MIIDDEESILSSMELILKSIGYDSRPCSTFIEAIKSLDTTIPDLIISDFSEIDDMNGIQFYLNHVARKQIPFVLFTGRFKSLCNEIELNHLAHLPENYEIQIKTAQKYCEICISNCADAHSEFVFPVFDKPGDTKKMIDYFNL